MVILADGNHVVKRLKEVRDWAAYIHETLTEDQPFEREKVQVMERVVGKDSLQDLQQGTMALVARLEGIIGRLEFLRTEALTR